MSPGQSCDSQVMCIVTLLFLLLLLLLLLLLPLPLPLLLLLSSSQELINDVAVSYASTMTGERPPDFQFCEYLNISICPASETGSVSCHVYHVAVM